MLSCILELFDNSVRLEVKSMSEAEQFLDLIAENAQTKEEIQNIQKYDRAIRMFDRKILKICISNVMGDETPKIQLGNLIKEIRLGVQPVGSAESFKQKMIKERSERINNTQKARLDELNKNIKDIQAKYDDYKNKIVELEEKIREHQQKLNDADKIKNGLEQQIMYMQESIESNTKKRDELNAEITKEQAMGISLRRSIEQTQRSLSEFEQNGNGSEDQLSSIRATISKLRTQMSGG